VKDIWLLIAPDEEGRVYGRMLRLELEDAGYTVEAGESLDGFSVCRLALLDTRSQHLAALSALCKQEKIPFLAYGSTPFSAIATVSGLGKESYLQRPFSASELIERCTEQIFSAKLPRAAADTANAATIQKTSEVSVGAEDVIFRGCALSLTGKEYALFCCLWEAQRELVSRETIYRTVWKGAAGERTSNIVDACIRNLRKKLDERFGLRLIRSVRGRGYLLDLNPKGEML
jgi:DNA-binding response OmpR family regulator